MASIAAITSRSRPASSASRRQVLNELPLSPITSAA
jgi:hypothetical protein